MEGALRIEFSDDVTLAPPIGRVPALEPTAVSIADDGAKDASSR